LVKLKTPTMPHYTSKSLFYEFAGAASHSAKDVISSFHLVLIFVVVVTQAMANCSNSEFGLFDFWHRALSKESRYGTYSVIIVIVITRLRA